MRRDRLPILLVSLTCFLHGVADAQQNRPRRAIAAASEPVFVPNDQAMAAKQDLRADRVPVRT